MSRRSTVDEEMQSLIAVDMEYGEGLTVKEKRRPVTNKVALVKRYVASVSLFFILLGVFCFKDSSKQRKASETTDLEKKLGMLDGAAVPDNGESPTIGVPEPTTLEAPEEKNLSDPDVQDVPDVPDVPDVSDIPEVPDVSNQAEASPAANSENELEMIVPRCSEESARCAVYAMEFSGMGSALVSLFMTKVYLKLHGRDYFVADESRYPFYRSKDGKTGVLNTFFTPQFPVLDSKEQYKYVDPVVAEGQSMEMLTHFNKKRSPWRDEYTESSPVVLARRPDYRGGIHQDLRSMEEEDIWKVMKEEMCPSMRYNDETQAKVDEIRLRHSLPSLLEEDKPSVAFHVRRSDKVSQHESELTEGKVYVEKLLEVAPGVDFGKCYIASDDELAVAEVEQALDEAGIQCDHLSLNEGDKKGGKHEKYTRSTYDSSLIFLTELSMLVEASYFVGKWDSNVAVMATVLRGCPQFGHTTENFANSYHLDKFGFLKDGHAGV